MALLLNRYVIGAAAIIIMIITIYMAGRNAADRQHETADMRATIEAQETRNEVERDVAREPDAVSRLRDEWSR